MYSSPKVAVDKGLGFDLSDISNLVKTALPTGLQIFSQQMQLSAMKKNPTVPYYGAFQSPSVYGNQYGVLPMSQILQPQPTFGGQYGQPSSGFGTGTILAIGAAAVIGILAFKLLK